MAKLKNLLFILVFLLFGITKGNAQSSYEPSITVSDPEAFWVYDKASLSSAQFTFRPQGVYMEVGMYFTFSAKGSSFETFDDALEAELSFRLPEGSLVTDSWLWIGDEIIQAAVEERWVANRIYNEIVGRRIDPSIMTKIDDKYLLRVYPLASDSTRRVKINYLTPLQWSKGKASIPVPVDILGSSHLPIEDLSFFYFPSVDFSNPNFIELANSNFVNFNHTELGPAKMLDLKQDALPDQLNLEVNVRMNNGVFISNYKEEDKDYYQITIVPNEALDMKIPKKHILFALDYDTSKTSLEVDEIIAILRSQIESQLEDEDFFNIILPYSDLSLFSGSWIKATKQNVQNVFNLIEEDFNEIVEQESFGEILLFTKDLIESENSFIDIMVLSLNGDFANSRRTDSFVDVAKEFIDPEKVRMHFIHYQDKFSMTEWNYFYRGLDDIEDDKYDLPNYSLYEQLSDYSNGSFQYLLARNNINQLLSGPISSVSKFIDKPKISYATEGDCIEEYDVPQIISDYHSSPIVKVGGCKGGPISLLLEAETTDGPQSRTINLEMEVFNEGNEKTKISYFGNFILSLEDMFNLSRVLSRPGIETIIDYSKRFRVLSNYTAFLALEKEIGGFVCEYCVDETDPNDKLPENTVGSINNSTNEIDLNNISFGEGRGGSVEPIDGEEIITSTSDLVQSIEGNIKAFPNPFSNSIEISIINLGLESLDQLELSIIDMNGSLVKKFGKDEIVKVGEYLIVNWNGNSMNGKQVLSGVYVVSLSTSKFKSTFKLVKVDR